MSTLFSLVGFCVQLVVIFSSIALIIDTHEYLCSQDTADEPDATLSIASSACAKVMTSPAITITVYNTVNSSEYNAMTVKQLHAFCRSNGIKGYSGLRKAELIRLVEECYLPW